MRWIALSLMLSIWPSLLASQDAYIVKGHCPDDGLPRFSQWFENSGLASGKPYVAEAKRRRQIVEGYPKLRLNMSPKTVEAVMGLPDYSQPKLKGHLDTSPAPNPPVCNAQLAYILKKDSDNAADTNDAAVFVFFTPDDKLYWGTPQNVPGLQAIGSPAP
jgi:hypothetical protein